MSIKKSLVKLIIVGDISNFKLGLGKHLFNNNIEKKNFKKK